MKFLTLVSLLLPSGNVSMSKPLMYVLAIYDARSSDSDLYGHEVIHKLCHTLGVYAQALKAFYKEDGFWVLYQH